MISYKKYRGFSLIEVMMTLLVVSLVMVLMAPFVTKKIKSGEQDGVVYTYNDQFQKTTGDVNNYCFTTNLNATGNIVYEATTDCSEYEFTVPKGVTSVNLTLVAGGGGGGGASGMLYWKSTKNQRGISGGDFTSEGEVIKDIFKTSDNIDIKNIKRLAINYLMPAGQPTKLPGCGGAAADNTGELADTGSNYCKGKTGDINWSQHLAEYAQDHLTLDSATGKYTWKTGKGGASSPALVDYEVPKSVYKYSSLTDILDDASRKEYLSMNINMQVPKYGVSSAGDNANKFDIDGNTDYDYDYENANSNNIIYKGKNTDGRGGKAAVYANMKLGNKEYRYKVSRVGDEKGKVSIVQNDTNYPLPQIPEKNIIPLKDGKEGVDFYFKDTNGSGHPIKIVFGGDIDEDAAAYAHGYNVTYFGGEGASINIGAYGNCGIGGHGYSFSHKTDSEGPHNLHSQTINFGTSCLESSVTYIPASIVQKPGGNGGAGGTAVRIVDFKVTPGTTYIIRVGKGGAGGVNGTDKIAAVNRDEAPVGGQNGRSGVSTSIWERTYDSTGKAVDRLVYLVTGGLGGHGGEYKGLSTNAYTQKTVHRLVSNNNNAGRTLLESTVLDRNIAEKINDVGAITLPMNAGSFGMNALAIVESYIGRRPYTFLNYTDTTFASRCTDDTMLGNTMGTNSCSSGYNAYNKSNETTFNSHLIANVQPNGNVAVTAYDGLYHKTYDNNGGAAYVGGLGGFSGLGTKAGCGGMFMGNSRGIILGATGITDSDNQSTNVQNKFISPQETVNFKENRNIYSAFEYYDNCTMATPDGQSAKFIAPDPKILNYGQAGSGGGGGGYTMDKGAGKGGNGQDGYVMIDWRK